MLPCTGRSSCSSTAAERTGTLIGDGLSVLGDGFSVLGRLFGRGAKAKPRGVSIVAAASGCSAFSAFLLGEPEASGSSSASACAFLADSFFRRADLGTMYRAPAGSGFSSMVSGPSSVGACSFRGLALGFGVLYPCRRPTTDHVHPGPLRNKTPPKQLPNPNKSRNHPTPPESQPQRSPGPRCRAAR